MARRLAIIAAAMIALTGCTPWFDIPGAMDPRTDVIAPGDQAMIDRGHVVNWSGCWPGDVCTVVLAGHRTTHGAVFREVANLQTGDIVRLSHGGQVYDYEVTDHEIVCCYDTVISFTGDLVLLTSAGRRRVHVIYAAAVE